MSNIPPSMKPRSYSATALLFADLLTEGLATYEQVSLGSWFQLLGQAIITNAWQENLLLERGELDKVKNKYYNKKNS